MNVIDLPNVMLIQIFEYLPYEEVAKKRLVCKRIDMICQHILNCGFNKVVKQHTISLKRIKTLLPRRESERRNHCLARHADILTCIETRISMLSMTYSKYMDLNLCCFIPGRVLDEIFRILRLISKTSKPLRPHEVLQELRDISSMAIEHFDEKISHSLKKSFVDTNTQMYMSNNPGSSGSSTSSSSSRNVCCDQMRQKVNFLLGLGQTSIDTTTISITPKVPTPAEQPANQGEQNCGTTHATMIYIKKIEQQCKKGFAKMNRMRHLQTIQSQRLQKSMSTISELSSQVIELKKRMEDMDAKNRELSASIKQLNGESTAPSTPQSTATAQEYSNSDENSDMIQEISATSTDDDLVTIANAKRHLDEPPLLDENISLSTAVNTAKKSKIE